MLMSATMTRPPLTIPPISAALLELDPEPLSLLSPADEFTVE